MEEKKPIKVSLGAVVSVFIIMILIIALGAVYYLGIVKKNEKIAELEKNHQEAIEQLENSYKETIEKLGNELQKDNEAKEEDETITENKLKEEDVLGTYEYDVPQEVRDEYGHYYDGTTIELLANNKFEYHCGEGFVIRGVYSIDKDNNIVCDAKTREGEYVEEHEVNYKYTFKYSNNILEVISCEGFEVKAIHEELGSKYIKK